MPSSVIRTFAYDAAARTLDVQFVTGRRYRYLDVPAKEVEGLTSSGSLGRYFNRRIRDHYLFRRLGPRDGS